MEYAKDRNETTMPVFLETHSAALRIWHWLTFIFMMATILTVFIASTFLDTRSNVGMIERVLQEKGVQATQEQAFSVAREFEERMWDWHKILGFGLAVMLIGRLIIELTQPTEERVRSRMKSAILMSRSGTGDKTDYRHYTVVKWSYFIFYLALLFLVITGLLLAFSHNLGMAGSVRHSIREIHGAAQYLIYAFVVFHIGGAIMADLGKFKGVISGMIHGNP